jgi:hypothetical protein
VDPESWSITGASPETFGDGVRRGFMVAVGEVVDNVAFRCCFFDKFGSIEVAVD